MRYVCLLLVLTACAGNIDPARQVEDAAVATSVRQALQDDAQLRPYTITVDVRRGVVTLTGRVRNGELRDRATTVASGVQGVSHVENLLTVE